MKKIYVFTFVLLAAVCSAVGQPCITISPAYVAGEEFNLCGGKTATYNCTPVEGATGYNWTVPSGFTIVSGQGTSNVTIKTAALFTTADLKVSAVFPCGNSIQTVKKLNAVPRNYNEDMKGPIQVVRGSTNNYSLSPAVPGLKYSWVAYGSSVVGGWNTNSVSIKVGPTVKYGQVQATVSNSCGGTISWMYFNVIEAANCGTLQVDYNVTNPDKCPGSKNGAASAIVTGGNPPYRYRWEGPDGFISTSKNISGLGVGSYWIYVTDSLGCTAENYLYMGDMYPSTMPPYPITGPTDNLCGEKTLTYTATETPGASAYNWTVPAGFTLVSGQGTKTVTIKTPKTFDTAFLRVTATLACGEIEPIYVELRGTPSNQEFQITGPDQVAVGSINTYTLPPLTGVSYSWVADGGNVVGGWGSNSVSVKAGVINGYVRATVKNACGAPPISTKFFTVRTGDTCILPNVYPVVTKHPERCLGSKTGEVRLEVRNGVGPFTYQWTGPNGFYRTVKDISAIEAGLYKVKVFVPGGCYVEEVVRVGPPDVNLDLPYPIRGPQDNLCGGKTVTYTCSALEGAISYNWVIPAGFTLISGQGTYEITLKTPASFDTALLQVSADLPCGNTGLRSLQLRGGALGDLSGSIVGPDQVVAGSTNVYSLPAMPGVSYSWVADGGNVVSGWNTNSVSIRAGTISGYVKVTLKNGCGTAPLARKYFTVVPASSVASTSVLDELPVAARFTVNPNPVYDRATVQFSSENNERYQIRVVDIYGKVLQVKAGTAVAGSNIVKLDLGGYAKGMYIVNLITKKQARTIKLMKK